jgi:hypothetical protein
MCKCATHIGDIDGRSISIVQDSCDVVGYPTGGDNVSITHGIVSRIEPQPYAHGTVYRSTRVLNQSHKFLKLHVVDSHVLHFNRFDKSTRYPNRCRHQPRKFWRSSNQGRPSRRCSVPESDGCTEHWFHHSSADHSTLPRRRAAKWYKVCCYLLACLTSIGNRRRF